MEKTKVILIILIVLITAAAAAGTFYLSKETPTKTNGDRTEDIVELPSRITIAGSVTCKTSNTTIPVPNTKITIINESLRTFVEVETDDKGNFSFFNFEQAGKYNISMEIKQFAEDARSLSNGVTFRSITSVLPAAKVNACEGLDGKYQGCNLIEGDLYSNFDFRVIDSEGICVD